MVTVDFLALQAGVSPEGRESERARDPNDENPGQNQIIRH